METTLDQLLTDAAPASGGQHSRHARGWWLTTEAVVCDFGHTDPKTAGWKMLAYGLEYVERHGKQKLVLVMPRAPAEICAIRAGVLREGLVDVWRHTAAGTLQSVPVLEFDDAVNRMGKARQEIGFRPDPLDTEALPGWLLELGDWVESRAVERVRTDNYWSWHYRGRGVLTVAPRGGSSKPPTKYEVLAGVKFTGANKELYGGDTFTKVVVPAEEQPSQAVIDEIQKQVDAAIERRRVKDDDGHREHMLQGVIGDDPSLVGMRYVRRELASGRLTSSSATFIDFLGVDDDGGLHVIETKLGDSDVQMGVQGLDYWAWATAHRDEIVQRLRREGHDDVSAEEPITLRFVIGRKKSGRTMHAAARATIAALHEDVPWRVQVLANWDMLAPSHRPLSLPEDVGPTRDRMLPEDSA